MPLATASPRHRLPLLLLLAAAVLSLSLSLPGAAASPYDTTGPYAVAMTRAPVLATAPNPGGGSAVPDLGCEEGEFLAFYPTGTEPGMAPVATLHCFPFQLNSQLPVW